MPKARSAAVPAKPEPHDLARVHAGKSEGGATGDSFDRAMDARISRLHSKLRVDPKNPRPIKTIYDAGYLFLGDVTWS
ncbi:transcriptional regulatory protein [Puniceibacterium sp. IMCC21224]|nr:transcriptional regulatory protein [Puniceibacterium sp. IMCC21224]